MIDIAKAKLRRRHQEDWYHERTRGPLHWPFSIEEYPCYEHLTAYKSCPRRVLSDRCRPDRSLPLEKARTAGCTLASSTNATRYDASHYWALVLLTISRLGRFRFVPKLLRGLLYDDGTPILHPRVVSKIDVLACSGYSTSPGPGYDFPVYFLNCWT